MGKLEEIKDKVAAKVNEVKADHETGADGIDDRLDQKEFETKGKLEELDNKLD